MKHKTRIFIITCIIGISAFAGSNFLKSGNISIISLDDIIVMAMAEETTQLCYLAQQPEQIIPDGECHNTIIYEGECIEVEFGSPSYCESYFSVAFWNSCTGEFHLSYYESMDPKCNAEIIE